MHTHKVGTVTIDEAKLRHELEVIDTFRFVEPYQEFVCGHPSRSVMLWTAGGDAGDGIIAHYDENAASGITEYGKQLPYLAEIIESSLSMRHLRFARLAVLSSNVLVPHRDYVEFNDSAASTRPAHRLHIPLVTNPGCLFSEDNVIYRMAVGEVWFLDVTRVHSAAALSQEPRIHLIVDFDDVEDSASLLSFPSRENTIPESSLVRRPPLSEPEREALYALAPLLEADNLKEVFGLIAKKHYRRDGGDDFFWNTISELRRRVADPAMKERLSALSDHFLLERLD